MDTVQAVEDVVEIRPYGLRGERQHGIDIIAQKRSGQWRAIQARRVKRFGLAELRGIVDPFIAGVTALRCGPSGDRHGLREGAGQGAGSDLPVQPHPP
jgi:hypothetical protein